MRINVGSKNQTKIDAVIDALKLYPKLFPSSEIKGIDVKVKEYDHPRNLDQTVIGAVERAKSAFNSCDYSFGLEGGLIEVPVCKTGYMEITVCAIYDGVQVYLGLGPGFEWPKRVTEMILTGEIDASLAFFKLGLSKIEKLGSQKGGISGYLTNGRMTRETQIKYSIINALIYLERPELR